MGPCCRPVSLARLRFSVTMRYIFLRASKERITSSLPRYLNLGLRASVNGILGFLPNIKKKACSFGRKLYAAIAIEQTSSHSSPGLMCFAMQAFKNKWNPSILLFDWGWYGGEYTLCSIPNSLAILSKRSFLNLVPLSDRIFLEGRNT